jgi:hypothetical protein
MLHEAAEGEEVRRSLDIQFRFNPEMEGDGESASAVQHAVEQVRTPYPTDTVDVYLFSPSLSFSVFSMCVPVCAYAVSGL